MGLPSVKTIQTAFPSLSADAIARIRWEMRNGPDVRVLRDIAETLQTYGVGYGVESIQHGHNVKSPAIAYVNMGDPYISTIMLVYSGIRPHYVVGCWGNYVERGNYD